MKSLSWPITIFLILALMVQNTCPHGFAGKTTLAKTCGSCSNQTHNAPAQDGLKSVSDHPSPDHPPMYIFALPLIIRLMQSQAIETKLTLLEDSYQDVLPDEIRKPPRA